MNISGEKHTKWLAIQSLYFADDVRKIDRSGENGKYITMALAICAFHTWTPETQDVCNGMLEVLLNSPTCGIVFNNFGKQFVKACQRR